MSARIPPPGRARTAGSDNHSDLGASVAGLRTTSPRLSEYRYQWRIVQYAIQAGWDVWHDSATNAPVSCRSCARLNLPSRFGCPSCGRPSPEIRNPKGKLDLELVRPPRVIFAEVKADGGRLSAEQVTRIAQLKACHGVEVYTWWPRDWPTVVRTLARYEWDLELIVPSSP